MPPCPKTDATPDAIICGDALSLLPTLQDRSINLVVTSPPYANQRRDHYPSVREKDYPAWIGVYVTNASWAKVL